MTLESLKEILRARKSTKRFKDLKRLVNNLVNNDIRSFNAETLAWKEFEEKLETLINSGFTFTTHKTVKSELKPMTYSLTRYHKTFFYLCYKDLNKQVYIFKTHCLDDKKNEEKTSNEMTVFKTDFLKENKVRFKDNFGSVSHDWKRFVPGLFHYDNPEFINAKSMYVGKVDFSSHFIACSLGNLPDANSIIEVDDYVEPNEDYQFAFYPDSGHIAEYNSFNSRDWLKEWGPNEAPAIWKSINNYKNKDTKTILMKPAKYNLNDLLLARYKTKLKSPKNSVDYQEAKLLMLKLVGKFEMNNELYYKSNPYCHLAAIIKGRAIQKMIDVINKIGKNNVISVIVDGLIYENKKKIYLGDKTEFLGSLKQENLYGFGQFRKHNQYLIKENNVINKCHAGLTENIDSLNIMDWSAIKTDSFRERIAKLSKIEYLNK